MSIFNLLKSKSERRAYAIGRKHERRINKNKINKKKKTRGNYSKKKDLINYHNRYRKRNLGALVFDGKIYDTNFKSGPIEITPQEIRELRREYQPEGVVMSDVEVADAYVKHMRRKFGVTDHKTGRFLGMISEVK